MGRMSKFTSAFKAKVAIEAIKEKRYHSRACKALRSDTEKDHRVEG